jgi:hypothetical protein
MPYLFETKWKKLRRENDRRVKLSASDKADILILISKWLSDKQIWEMYWVHRKTIYLIRNPEQSAKEKAAYKLRRLDWRYYNKDKHNTAIK